MSLNKTDLSFKKLINRQFTTPNRAFYQEVGANTLEIDSGMIYTSPISSSRASAISASVVRLMKCVLTKDYSGTVSTSSYYVISGSGYTVDANNYNANFTNLGANFFNVSSSYVQRNFLSEKYGTEYVVEIRNSAGTQLSPDSSINWYFDYKSGVLHVADTSLSTQPYSITASQYIGRFLDEASINTNVGTPEMYGAVGDGTTDDFLAFKHALISHSVVELGAKTYAVRGYIGMPSHRSLIGKGKDRTVIKLMNNSPYGYGSSVYVIQNTVLQDTVNWTGSVVGTTDNTGSVLLDYRDTTVRDQSPSSPFYQQTQSQPFAGLGYWQYDTSIQSIGGRRDILIEGLTVDCNFDRQARHASYNHSDNPYSASRVTGGTYYIPQYANRVRSTVHAIVLNGENIILKDVKAVNYGYGCDAAANGPLNYADSTTIPPYNENFPLLVNADNSALNYTSSDYDIGSDSVGLSRWRGNYAIGCEVLAPGSTDLLNPFSNATAIYVTNQSVNTSTGRSSFTSEGGIFDSIVDPGERIKTPSASLWSGSYLDSFVSSSLKQTAATLAEWLFTTQGSLTGSNGQVAMSNGSPGGPSLHLKKISGSWYPLGGYYSVQEHNVQGFSGYRMSRCLARNLEIGFYLDSWRNNAFLDNNQMVDVTSGFRYVVSDIGLTSSYKNVVIKDNYIKLSPHERAYVPGHGVVNYALDLSNGSGSMLRHVDNLVIEDNIFELPVSSSSNVYGSGNSTYRGYPRYVGFYLQHDVTPSGSLLRTHRAASIKNNKFFNWNPLKSATTSAGELYGYNFPFYFAFTTGSMGMDEADPAAGPYPLSVEKFKREVLPNWIISDNTYSDSDYPSTSSIVPITIQITGTGTNYFYPIDQVNRFAGVTANSITSTTASIRVLNATGSLQGSSSFATTASYALTSSYAVSSSYSVNAGTAATVTTNALTGSSLMLTDHLNNGASNVIAAGASFSHAEGFYTRVEGFAAHAEGFQTSGSGQYSHAEGGYTRASADYSHAEGGTTIASAQSSHAEGDTTHAAGFGSHAEGYITRAGSSGAHSEGYATSASATYSHAEGSFTRTLASWAHAEGSYTTASGIGAHAEGSSSYASGSYSHAEGGSTRTAADYSHAEGSSTSASAEAAHAEGFMTKATGLFSHAEGGATVASGQQSHAEGGVTMASGHSSHAEGTNTSASADYAHSEGSFTKATADYAHSEGNLTLATAAGAHSEGWDTLANALYSHAEGYHCTASGQTSHAEGQSTTAAGLGDHAEGLFTRAEGGTSHAEGYGTLALGGRAHSEGYFSTASGDYSHAEGYFGRAGGESSHAEGYYSSASGWFAHAEGNSTTSSGQGSHSEGEGTIASNTSAHAEGYHTIASSAVAHAEGNRTTASGIGSHSEGDTTVASGNYSHAEGYGSFASGLLAHAEGVLTTASGVGAHAEGRHTSAEHDYAHSEGTGSRAITTYAHAEGYFTNAYGTASHSEGWYTTASGSSAHAEGGNCYAFGNYSHAEGDLAMAIGVSSHAEGYNCTTSGSYSHAEGQYTNAIGIYSHTEGSATRTSAGALYAHAEGATTLASGSYSHAEGVNTVANAPYSHVEGGQTKTIGTGSHAEGYYTTASANYSHVEGDATITYGLYSHAEGYNTVASASYSHAEGGLAHASGLYSHAEGSYTSASNYAAHAEGYLTLASGQQSHAEGAQTLASGNGSHAEGQHTTASAHYQHVSGKYNVASANADDLFMIGAGTAHTLRSNIVLVNRKGVYINNGGYVSGSGFNIVSQSSLCINTTEPYADREIWSASLSVAGGMILKNGILLVTGSESNGGGNDAGSIFVKGCGSAPFLTLASKQDGPTDTQRYGLVQSSGKRLWLAAGTSPGILCIGNDDEDNAVSIGTTPISSYTLNVGPGTGTYSILAQGGISSSGNIYLQGNIDALSGVTSSVTSRVGFSGYMPAEFMVAVSDEISNLASGSNKLRFIFPYAMTGSSLTAYVHTAPVGAFITSSVRLAGGITISASISGSMLSGSDDQEYFIEKYQELSVDVEQVGSVTAGVGLKLIFNGIRKV